MAHYITIGDETVETPAEVRNEGRVSDWIIDQLIDRDLVSFDPRELSVDELAEAVQEVEDRQVLGLLRDTEDRATAVEAIEARADELQD